MIKYYIQVSEGDDGIYQDLSSPTNRAGFTSISELLMYALKYNISSMCRVVSREFVEKVV